MNSPKRPMTRARDIMPAEAALQHDDPAAAKKKLDALLANAPSDAPWRQIVADRLAELSQNVGAAPSVRAFGPLRDIAPALDGPQVAQSRICGRVEGLEQLLLRAPAGSGNGGSSYSTATASLGQDRSL